MPRLSLIAVLAVLIVFVDAFGGSEDRFIKKYAMMKIYESCFGPEVVKQIRKEMKAACMKCSGEPAPRPPFQQEYQPVRPPMQTPPSPQQPQQHPFDQNKMDGISDPENTIYANQQTFDADKLHQAIMTFRPNPGQIPTFRPQQPGIPGYYPGFSVPPFAAGPMYFPGYQQQQFAGPFSSYPYPNQPYFGQRISREMDVRGQLEALTAKMSGKVRNVTCVMQELGYLDENLEPNYRKITERIGSLPISDELRKDMQDGVSFCQQFSQCVPEIKKEKSPLSRELIRPMFFFKCYKHKKLEACIMKDVREKYVDVADEDLEHDVEFRRTSKAARLPGDGEIDELASSMYEFLYGTDSNLDLESIL